MPNGIESTGTCHVIFKRCVAQTASYKEPIDVMFVLQDIEIDTHTGIRSTGLEPYTCRFIGFISLSDTYFNDGIVPIPDVYTYHCFILTVIGKQTHGRSNHICTHCNTPKEGNAVLIHRRNGLPTLC